MQSGAPRPGSASSPTSTAVRCVHRQRQFLELLRARRIRSWAIRDAIQRLPEDRRARLGDRDPAIARFNVRINSRRGRGAVRRGLICRTCLQSPMLGLAKNPTAPKLLGKPVRKTSASSCEPDLQLTRRSRLLVHEPRLLERGDPVGQVGQVGQVGIPHGQLRMIPSTSSRRFSMISGVRPSRLRRKSGSVLDGRTLKCQSSNSTEIPSR
jgi:hypothetical protein